MKRKTYQLGYTKSVSLSVWLFAAAAIGGFSSLLIYMDQYEKGHLTENKTINFRELLKDADSLRISSKQTSLKDSGLKDKVTAGPQQVTSNNNSNNRPNDNPQTKTDSSRGKKPAFDFYSLLPEMEVVVPDTDFPIRSKTKTNNDPNASKSTAAVKPEVKSPDNTITKAFNSGGKYFIQAGAFRDLRSADRRKANLALIGIKSSIVSVDLKSRGVWHRVRVGPFADIKKMSRVRSVMKSNNITSIAVKVKS